ncbi:sigma-E processing peptidase SpoIIGA [Thermovenabulum sp.]|uniref:sigma-E processing peptidase SpoIIGA n=1 Tax=Thermovenabulum sp. TaxID=3100335 RepID=UPI003C7E4EE9
MVIYIDVVFLINMFMNFIILWATSFVLQKKIKFWKMLFGAFIGNLALIEMLLPEKMNYLGKIIKFLLPFAVVMTSFNPRSKLEFFRLLIVFIFMSFLTGAITLAFYYLFNLDYVFNYPIINNISIKWWLLLLTTIFIVLFLKEIWPNFLKKVNKEDMILDIQYTLNNRSGKAKALLDTGHELKEPIDGLLVVIIELEKIREILERKDFDIIKKFYINPDYNSLVNNISDDIKKRLRIIPYKTIGNTNGILLGIKIDFLKIYWKGKTSILENVILGLFEGALSSDGSYRALINYDFI